MIFFMHICVIGSKRVKEELLSFYKEELLPHGFTFLAMMHHMDITHVIEVLVIQKEGTPSKAILLLCCMTNKPGVEVIATVKSSSIWTS